MREKKILNKFLMYNYTDLEAIKEYLEEMALKGWLLKDMNTWITLEKAEPQKVIYSIELDNNASVYDMNMNVNEVENLEECLRKGWVLVTGFGKIKVYKTKNENAIPIIKDEKEKLANIVTSTIKQRAILWFVLPFIFLANLILVNINNSNLSELKILSNLIYIVFYALLATQIISFLVWKSKAKKRVENGEKANNYDLKQLITKNRIFKNIFLVFLICLFLIGVISLIFGYELIAILVFFMVGTFVFMLLITVWIQRMRLNSTSTILLSIGIGAGIGILLIIALTVIIFNIIV